MLFQLLSKKKEKKNREAREVSAQADLSSGTRHPAYISHCLPNTGQQVTRLTDDRVRRPDGFHSSRSVDAAHAFAYPHIPQCALNGTRMYVMNSFA